MRTIARFMNGDRSDLSPKDPMSFMRGTLTLTRSTYTLGDLLIELVSDRPTVERPVPWFAKWAVPADARSRQFLEQLFTDDAECTLMLEDGRSGDFSCAFDGAVLLMQGLQPLRSIEDVAS